jgi:hypothetical protein
MQNPPYKDGQQLKINNDTVPMNYVVLHTTVVNKRGSKGEK